MTKERKQPAIRKPLIDEETALRFASAPQPETSKKAGKLHGNGKVDATVQLTVNLSSETYARIIQEAARKKRSVEELLQRHLNKHYGKN